MKHDSFHRGALLAALVLALWVGVSPWVVSEASENPALLNFCVAGLLAIGLAAAALMRTDDWAQYVLVAVGTWLVVSPWILDLESLVTRQAVSYGVVIAGLAWVGRPSFQPKREN